MFFIFIIPVELIMNTIANDQYAIESNRMRNLRVMCSIFIVLKAWIIFKSLFSLSIDISNASTSEIVMNTFHFSPLHTIYENENNRWFINNNCLINWEMKRGKLCPFPFHKLQITCYMLCYQFVSSICHSYVSFLFLFIIWLTEMRFISYYLCSFI